MIRYLENKNIDRTKWDLCIARSVNTLVYARSWCLDIASPGWDALVDDDYESVFPLPNRSKFGIRYIYQPYFVQQLGIFSGHRLTPELTQRFLDAIPPKFRFAEIHLNTFNKADPGSFTVVPRVNLELDLINLYDNLAAGYDQNTRRNVRKAIAANLTIQRKVEPDELIALFRDNYGKREGKLNFSHYNVIRQLMAYALKNTFSTAVGVYENERDLCAGAFFLKEPSRVIFLFAASNEAARQNGAMFLLVDSFIREHAGQAVTLDFEGSNDPNVARFYKGFGARECTYQLVRIDRMNPLTRKVVAFVKNVRS
jgi:hypothetical protein